MNKTVAKVIKMTSPKTTGKEPTLSIEEERDALSAWQEHGDRKALGRLLSSHARMAWSAARRLTNDGALVEDLVSAGMVAMIDAANRFDVSRNVRFNTYASWFVKNGVLDAMIRAKGVVDVPPRVYLDARAGRLDPVRHASAIAAAEAVVAVDTGAGESGESAAVVPCPGKTPEELVSIQSVQDQVKRLLEGALNELDPMEQAVIRKRLDADCLEESQPVLALKITRAKLGSIERRAMHRLRQLLQQSGFTLAMLDN